MTVKAAAFHLIHLNQAKCAAALLAEVELLTQQLDEEAGSRLAAEEQAEAANMQIEGLEQQLEEARVRQPAAELSPCRVLRGCCSPSVPAASLMVLGLVQPGKALGRSYMPGGQLKTTSLALGPVAVVVRLQPACRARQTQASWNRRLSCVQVTLQCRAAVLHPDTTARHAGWHEGEVQSHVEDAAGQEVVGGGCQCTTSSFQRFSV